MFKKLNPVARRSIYLIAISILFVLLAGVVFLNSQKLVFESILDKHERVYDELLDSKTHTDKALKEEFTALRHSIIEASSRLFVYQIISVFILLVSLAFLVLVTFSKLGRSIEQRTGELEENNAKLKKTLQELQSTQAQLIESEKMASLGGLVAGIAHEINTPIGIGITAISHLSDKTGTLKRGFDEKTLKRSQLDSYIAMAQQTENVIFVNLERAAELIKSFKQVAVDQSSEEIREFELCYYLKEILLSLRPKLKRTKHTTEIICKEAVMLKTYPGALSQVITNLIVNSLMHGFGKGEQGEIKIKVTAGSGSVKIAYTDSGRGIREEDASRVFQPFFTTMRGKGGSGLGLNIVYNIITQKLGGRIECVSRPGKGALFEMEIPVSINPASIDLEHR